MRQLSPDSRAESGALSSLFAYLSGTKSAYAMALAAWIAACGLMPGRADTDYPSRVVRIFVPSGPGGAADLTARSVAQTLGDSLGKTFIVESRVGAQGLVAATSLLNEKHDGYTLMMMTASQSVLPALYKLPFDPLTAFSPIVTLSSAPVILVVNSSLPVKSVADLIQYAKQHPGNITYGYQGSPPQLASAIFAKMAGIDAIGVPFTASAQAATELIAGRLTFELMTAEQAKAHVSSGSLRALATAAPKKSAAFPDLQTLQDMGYPVDGSAWHGLVGPSGMPQEIVKKLYAAIEQDYIGKKGQAAIVAAGLEPENDGPEKFEVKLQYEINRWIKTAAELGITPTQP